MTNWLSDPNVLGSFSYAKVGTRTATFNNLKKVLNSGSKNLWFIGEGTNPNWYSYTNGAYDSGVEAATAALRV